jgi:hypothetical protein
MALHTLKIRHLSPQKVPFNYGKNVQTVKVNNCAYINKTCKLKYITIENNNRPNYA